MQKILTAALLAATCVYGGTSAEVYQDLHGLIGRWEAKPANGSVIRVSYRTLAGDSALVETFTTASGRETLTIYHPDGESLMATHYCGQGNQPRLRLESVAARSINFAFVDATNLPDPGTSHLVRLKIQMLDDNHFDKTEIYAEHGKHDTTVLHFVRVAQNGK
jgi:hypothetical protein